MEGSAPRQPIIELSRIEVDKISAGEVVERPLNVVKELIENSLDAGATAITVELEDGGRQLVRVTDNGGGIPSAELALALMPHHTSKIRNLEDIYNLTTMGFRGEALSSIAAVSRLKITSCHSSEQVGAMVESSGGETAEAVPAGFRTGTEIEVRELFYNTPVRLKFLRSRTSETSQVSRIITSYALAYPEVSWRLTSSGRELANTSGCSTLRETVANLLGPELGTAMLRVGFEFPPMAVGGLVSPPHLFLHNRSRQWFFINRRPVVNKLLYKAVDDAVREFVSANKHPAGIFLIELPPEEIDVNVHPMKTEVSFSQPQSVYSLLSTAIRRALGAAGRQQQQRLSQGLSSVIRPVERPAQSAADPTARAAELQQSARRLIDQRTIELPAELPLTAVSRQTARPAPDQPEMPPNPDAMPAPPGATARMADGRTVRISQVAGSYLVASTTEAVYLIDQHEAHERILFETLYSDLRHADHGPDSAQGLLFNLEVELSAAESQVAGDYLDALQQVGFGVELTTAGCLQISAIPLILRGRADAALIHGMLEDLIDSGVSSVLEERRKSVAAITACRAAVKGNDHLTPAEREWLVLRLLESASSLSCPHGSPTVIRLGLDELRKMFIR